MARVSYKALDHQTGTPSLGICEAWKGKNVAYRLITVNKKIME